MDIKSFLRFTLAVLLLNPFVYGHPVAASERLQEIEARIEANAEQLRALYRLGSNVEVRYGHHGTVRSITGDLDLVAPDREAVAESGEHFLEMLRVPLGLKGDETLVNPKFRSGIAGTSSLRFHQEIAGIPVVGASLAIGFRDRGNADVISAKLLTDDGLSRTPAVALDDAKRIAAAAAFEDTTNVAIEAYRLAYYYSADERGALAWEVQVASRSVDAHGESYRVYVDARTAEPLATVPLQYYARTATFIRPIKDPLTMPAC